MISTKHMTGGGAEFKEFHKDIMAFLRQELNILSQLGSLEKVMIETKIYKL